ncbi:MAG: MFS transporter [Oscillospiraceae bacterium]|jgi:MFS family permease|nr:MFS transporter [Oscillospiraceae bacterium]
MPNTNLKSSADTLSLGRILLLSLPYAWISVFNSVLDNGLPVILTALPEDGGLGLTFTAKGVVMALDNILGLFLLPLFGRLSDKSRSRFGKRTPFILIGGIGALLTWIGAGVFLGIGAKWMFLILLTGGLAAIAMGRPASLALLPDFSPLHQRRDANAITQIVSIVCTVVGIAIVGIFSPKGYQTVFYATSAALLVLVVVYVFAVKERRWTPPPAAAQETEQGHGKSSRRTQVLFLLSVFFFYIAYNGLISSLSNYAVDVLNLDKQKFVLPQALTLVVACIAAVPVAKLQKRFKRKTLLVGGMALMTAAFALASLQPQLNAMMFVSFLLVGAGFAAVIVNLYPFQLELSPPDKIGSSTGLFNTVITLAMVLTPIASGALADWQGMWTLFPYCIAALVLALAFLVAVRAEDAAA